MQIHFFEMKKIAMDFGITVVWFYVEPGHGCGLVDAMSSFGCKQKLCHKIITNDSWFPNFSINIFQVTAV